MGSTVLAVIVVALMAACSQVSGQVPGLGRCPAQGVVQNFNVAAYLGKWYEQAKYFAIFQLGGKCVTATYTDTGTGSVGVENKQINVITNAQQTIVGTATLNDSQGGAKLVVRFPSAGNFPGDYWVLNTDYSTYAIVWSCNDFKIANTQFMWILTRQKNPSPELLNNIYGIIRQRGLSTFFLRKTTQDCAN